MAETKTKDPITPLAIPPELRAQLYESAQNQGRTLSGHILMILKAAMSKEFGK